MYAYRYGLAGFLMAVYAAMPAGAEERVFCHDAGRDTVSHVPAASCRGVMVDAAKAAEIKQRRVQRLKSAFGKGHKIQRQSQRLQHGGSGIILSGNGDVMTNAHVVADCARITVADEGGERVEARIREQHPVIDLAVLATPLAARAPAIFRQPKENFEPKRTDLIGYPQLGLQTERPQFARGKPLREPGLKDDAFHLFVKAAVRAGYSGGPVLDHAGLVIGIVFAQIDTPWYYNRTGKLLRDVGVAIPTAAILPFLEDSGIRFRQRTDAPEMPPDLAFEARKSTVVRISCWR